MKTMVYCCNMWVREIPVRRLKRNFTFWLIFFHIGCYKIYLSIWVGKRERVQHDPWLPVLHVPVTRLVLLVDALPLEWPDKVRFHLLRRFTQLISENSKQRQVYYNSGLTRVPSLTLHVIVQCNNCSFFHSWNIFTLYMYQLSLNVITINMSDQSFDGRDGKKVCFC